MASPAAEIFATIAKEDGAITPEIMESFAHNVKLELAAGGAELAAEVSAMVRATQLREALVVDVRSPGEYARGHVPGAVNVPLFSDEERAKVGTCFAKQGRGQAMVLGMRAVRPKLDTMLRTILHLAETSGRERGPAAAPASDASPFPAPVTVYVHCWRGGMRSSCVTWLLLHSAPPGVLDARVVRGGYKSFRRWVLSRWTPPAALTRASSSSSLASTMSSSSTTISDEAPSGAPSSSSSSSEPHDSGPRVCIVGGRTGVGKTRALLALRALGQQVVDLEGLAAHSGSAFGWVGRPPAQPTSEHFSNLVAMEWAAMASAPRWVFVEDEGPHVGKCSVDPGLFQRMRHAPLVVNVVAPEEVRLRTLVQDYAGDAHRNEPGWLEAMSESVGKLHKRLGGKNAQELQARLAEGNFEAVAEGLLTYYDGLYDRHLGNKRVEKHANAAVAEAEKPRAGKTVACPAHAVGDVGGGRHPHELDVERLARDILAVVAAFEEEEARDAAAAAV